MRQLLLAIILLFAFSTAHGQDLSLQSGLVNWHELTPGSVEAHEIPVRNTSTEEIRVKVEVKNYLFGVDRDGYENSHNRSLNGHLQPLAREVRIPPKGRRVVEYRVQMPPNAKKGSYWSMLLISSIPENSGENGGISLQQKYQFGVNIIATSGGEVNLESRNIKVSNGKLHVTIENTGEVSVRPRITLEGYHENGSEEQVDGFQHLLHPNTSVRTTFNVSEFEPGSYTGALIFEGRSETYGLRINFQIPE